MTSFSLTSHQLSPSNVEGMGQFCSSCLHLFFHRLDSFSSGKKETRLAEFFFLRGVYLDVLFCML
jgi:hypothetical protein